MPYVHCMRIAIFSDVHGRRARLERLLEQSADCDEHWCLGDTVGWDGEDGIGALQLVRTSCQVALAGNHDLAAIGKIPDEDFSAQALRADAKDRAALSGEPELRKWLAQLPTLVEIELAGFGQLIACHGTPRNPIWEYATRHNAEQILAHVAPARLVVHGHTHELRAWRLRRDLHRPLREIHLRGDRQVQLGTDPIMIGVGTLSHGRRAGEGPTWVELDTSTETLTPRQLR